MLNAKVWNNERAGLEIETPTDNWATWRGRSGDVASLEYENNLLGSAELPESGCGFVLQGAVGKMLMARECPKIRRSKAEN
jgi:hypothetical protein